VIAIALLTLAVITADSGVRLGIILVRSSFAILESFQNVSPFHGNGEPL
jgi:hypothetical protein